MSNGDGTYSGYSTYWDSVKKVSTPDVTWLCGATDNGDGATM